MTWISCEVAGFLAKKVGPFRGLELRGDSGHRTGYQHESSEEDGEWVGRMRSGDTDRYLRHTASAQSLHWGP